MQSDGAAFLLNPNPQWRGCGERGALTLGLPGMGGRCGLQELPVRAESWEPQRPNLIRNRALLVVGVSLFFFFWLVEPRAHSRAWFTAHLPCFVLVELQGQLGALQISGARVLGIGRGGGRKFQAVRSPQGQ